jgi:hypothetical protein
VRSFTQNLHPTGRAGRKICDYEEYITEIIEKQGGGLRGFDNRKISYFEARTGKDCSSKCCRAHHKGVQKRAQPLIASQKSMVISCQRDFDDQQGARYRGTKELDDAGKAERLLKTHRCLEDAFEKA